MGTNHHVNETLLSASPQYRRLHSMHAQLENELEEISKHVCFDEASLKALKFRKLQIADQMSIIEHMQLT